jgi:phospholipid/cholesterol/gamma-HCH transport system substrate-binding protein
VKRPLGLLVAAAVLAAGLVYVLPGDPGTTVTARFSSAVGVYPGSGVRVLGVRIGTVTRVVPDGATVRLELTYEKRYRVPAGAVAVIVAPSVTGDRYVQLAPAYTGGPALRSGDGIPASRTATPAETDDVYRGLAGLTKALGPDGANSTGSLSRLIETAKLNLDGQGAQLNQSIKDLATVSQTFADGSGDLAATIGNLQRFAAVLAASDARIREFTGSLATVSAELDGEKAALAASIRSLSLALAQVAAFVRQNRKTLATNVHGLTELSAVLARQKQAFATFLDLAPGALAGLRAAYNPLTGALDVRDQALGGQDPAAAVCAAVAAKRPPAGCAAGASIPATAAPDRTLGGILKGAS